MSKTHVKEFDIFQTFQAKYWPYRPWSKFIAPEGYTFTQVVRLSLNPFHVMGVL